LALDGGEWSASRPAPFIRTPDLAENRKPTRHKYLGFLPCWHCAYIENLYRSRK